MVVSFDVTTPSNDIFRVLLSSGEDTFFAGKDIVGLFHGEIEIVEIDLERIAGNNPATLSTLKRISEGIGNYFLENEKVILYYYCDDMNDIPFGNNRGLWPQEYRSELFSRMFQRQQQGNDDDITDVVVVLNQDELPLFMHLIARTRHLRYVDILKDYIITNYGK